MGVVDFLHQRVWRLLPREARRRLLFAATIAAAPRPDRPTPPGRDPIIVAGSLATASGLGESARRCVDALKAAGRDIRGVDLSSVFRHSSDLDPANWIGDGVPNGEGGTLVVHVNAPFMPMALAALGRRGTRGRRVVGNWAWELPSVPRDWNAGRGFVHEVWVPSVFCAEAVSPMMGAVPVRVLPYPVRRMEPAGLGERRWTRPEEAFVVSSVFNMASGFTRKNPLGAVAAFKRAFGDDPGARLILKTVNVDSDPAGARALIEAIDGATNIEIVDAVLSPGQLGRLYEDTDLLFSPHRSEGFGLTIAEAMAHGRPAAATDWSGNRDFTDADTGYPLPYRLVPARDPLGTYDHPDMNWADPDVDAAAAVLRAARGEPERRLEIGRRAAARVRETLSAEQYARRVASFLSSPARA